MMMVLVDFFLTKLEYTIVIKKIVIKFFVEFLSLIRFLFTECKQKVKALNKQTKNSKSLLIIALLICL